MPNELWVDIERFKTVQSSAGFEKQWEKVSKFVKDAENSKLRKFVRNGIPDELRGVAYSAILQIDSMPEYEKNFQLALQRTYGGRIPEQVMAPTFGGRTHYSTLAINKAGEWVIDHILSIIAHDFPNLEFCPFVPSLLMLLAHHLKTPDELLGGIVYIIKKSLACTEGSKERWFWQFNNAELNKAFLAVLKLQNKSLALQLEETFTSDGDPIWDRWFTDFFLDILPQEIIWRVLDVFILEGFKTFIRFGAAIFLDHSAEIIKSKPMRSELEQLLSQSVYNPEAFCKRAFSINFSNADIAKKKKPQGAVSIEDFHEAKYKFQRGQPVLKSESTVMTELHWILLWTWIPPRLRLSEVELLFTTADDGYNLHTMYNRTRDRRHLILVVKTMEDSIFGAFVSGGFEPSSDKNNAFHGDGETLLFTLEPFGKSYQWVHRDSETDSPSSSLFIQSAVSELTIGGGSSRGLWLNDTLTSGTTERCETFANEPLTGTKSINFETITVEVFGFQ